jgi:hypothetical protein
MSEFVDFKQISSRITFKQLFDNLNIPYSEKKSELKGEYKDLKFIVNTEKNLFLCTNNDNVKGSVINFLSAITGSDLRTAAIDLQDRFLHKPKEPERELPDLKLNCCDYLEAYGILQTTCAMYGVGLVKQKSIISGKIGFKCFDDDGKVIGYAAFNPKEVDIKKKWFFPQNFKRTLWNFHRASDFEKALVVCNPFDALVLIQKGFANTFALLGKSMTESQENALKKFKTILLLHPEPENLVLRLSKHCSVKSPLLIQPVKDYSAEIINAF